MATLRLLLALWACLWSMAVSAHALGVSRGEYRRDGDRVDAELTFAQQELVSVLPQLDSNGDGRIDVGELLAHEPQLREWLVAGWGARADDDRACAASVDAVTLADADGLRFSAHVVCPASSGAYRLRLALFESLTPGHRHIARLHQSEGEQLIALHRGEPMLELPPVLATGSDQTPWSLLMLGVEHIATGYDHLVFLFGLILVATRMRRIIGVITAFTVGHSLTLALATLGLWLPDTRVIEPLIALSIVYVGVENQWQREPRWRWLLALGFGLIHGFGFAGILREIELPVAAVPMALFSFNLGVELGQLVLLGMALPVIAQLRRLPRFQRIGVPTLNAAIVLAGGAWLVERTL